MSDLSSREVADLLHSAAIHLLRRAGEQDASAGITRARLSALSVVVFRGPLTLTALAAAEGVRPATMTRIVAGLEEAGFVRRTPNAADGRSVLLSATADGERVLAGARGRRIEAIAERCGLDPRLLVATSVQDVKMRAPRPQYAALSNAKLLAAGVMMPTWEDALTRYLARLPA